MYIYIMCYLQVNSLITNEVGVNRFHSSCCCYGVSDIEKPLKRSHASQHIKHIIKCHRSFHGNWVCSLISEKNIANFLWLILWTGKWHAKKQVNAFITWHTFLPFLASRGIYKPRFIRQEHLYEVADRLINTGNSNTNDSHNYQNVTAWIISRSTYVMCKKDKTDNFKRYYFFLSTIFISARRNTVYFSKC